MLDGSKPSSSENDPWIATTRDLGVAQFFNRRNRFGIVAINLDLVGSPSYNAWEVVDGPRARQLAWRQKEVAIQGYVPQQAVVGYVG